MRHGIAALVALSIVSLQGQSLAFHVHAIDHEHDRHRHAPAIHHHADFDRHDEAPHFSSPDAASSSITLNVPAAPPHAAIDLVIEAHAAGPLAELQPSGRTRVVDMRSHGPPGAAAASLRAPPSILPL